MTRTADRRDGSCAKLTCTGAYCACYKLIIRYNDWAASSGSRRIHAQISRMIRPCLHLAVRVWGRAVWPCVTRDHSELSQ